MKKYDTYKDSGIEWLGEIPEHWILTKLKYYLSVQSGIGIKNSEVIENGEFPIYGGNGIMGWTDKSNSTGEVLIIGRVGALCGNIHIVNDTIWISDNALWGKSFQNQKYLFYFLKFLDLNRFANKNAQPLITGTIVKVQEIGLPTLPEQDIIASFLDHKTTQIDTLIEKKEQLVEKLTLKRQAIINEAVTKGLNPDVPMKDSGIEWLGEIPEHWEVVKLKKIADAFGRIGYRGYSTSDIVEAGEGAITISPSNMKDNFMTFTESTYLSWDKYEESPEIKIFNDDILIVKTGSTYGKISIVKGLNYKATINPQLLVLKNIQLNPNYLYLVLRTPLIQSQVETEVVGSTIPTISQTKILNFSIILPPKNEITKILAFIEKKIEVLDISVKKISLSINKLKLYRQSLISEAVTGKIDLRDWEKPSD